MYTYEKFVHPGGVGFSGFRVEVFYKGEGKLGGVSMVKNGEILQWRNPFTIKIVHHFSPFFTIFHHFVFQFFKISIFCIGKLPLFFSLGVTALRHIIKDYNQCSYINLLLIIL